MTTETLPAAINEMHNRCSNSFIRGGEWACVGCGEKLADGTIAALAAHQTAKVMDLLNQHSKQELRLDFVRKGTDMKGSVKPQNLAELDRWRATVYGSDMFDTEVFSRNITEWKKEEA